MYIFGHIIQIRAEMRKTNPKTNQMMSFGLHPISSIKTHNIEMDSEFFIYVCSSQSAFLASSEASELE